jgi:hypothetical protein
LTFKVTTGDTLKPVAAESPHLVGRTAGGFPMSYLPWTDVVTDYVEPGAWPPLHDRYLLRCHAESVFNDCFADAVRFSLTLAVRDRDRVTAWITDN